MLKRLAECFTYKFWTLGLISGLGIAASVAEAARPAATSIVVGPAGRACVLWSTGQVDCWGDVVFGESISPVGNFRSVAMGQFHVCGTLENTTVSCWGRDELGRLEAPKVSLSGLVADWLWTCGIRDASGHRAVACWGRDDHEKNFLQAPTGEFAKLYGSSDTACGLTVDAQLKCWGALSVEEKGPFSSASLGPDGDMACGIESTGSLVCWSKGLGRNGSLSKSDAEDDAFKSVAIGTSAGRVPPRCGIRADGTIKCIGGGDSWPNVPGSFSSIAYIGAHGGHARFCAIGLDHGLLCWEPGQSKVLAPMKGKFTQLSGRDGLICAIRDDGTVACWSDETAVCNAHAFGPAKTDVPRAPLDEKGKFRILAHAIQAELDDWIACAKDGVTPSAENLQIVARALTTVERSIPGSDPTVKRLRASFKKVGGASEKAGPSAPSGSPADLCSGTPLEAAEHCVRERCTDCASVSGLGKFANDRDACLREFARCIRACCCKPAIGGTSLCE